MKTMMKKITSLLITLVLLLQQMPFVYAGASTNSTVWDGSIAASYAGGTGTSIDPFLISNGEQMARLAQEVNNGNIMSP